jgi:transcription antitermination factor NusG
MSSLSALDPEEFNWFVLFVRTNQEKTTAATLNTLGIEHFLPTFRSIRQWKDRRVTLEMPLFPGYVFVRFAYKERLRAVSLSGVLYLVGAGQSPAVLTEEEIVWIKRGVDSGKAVPHECLREGQRVVITSGALTSLKGILVRQANHARVVVSLDSIGRGFAVEVDLQSVSPCAETDVSLVPQRLPLPSTFTNADIPHRLNSLRRA